MAGSVGPETLKAERWLAARLAGDVQLVTLTGGRIYPAPAPDGTALPLVVYQYATQPDTGPVAGVGLVRLWEDVPFLVKAIVPAGERQKAFDILLRVDALLHGAANVAGDGITVLSCRRGQTVSYPETDARTGRAYRHEGAIYVIEALGS